MKAAEHIAYADQLLSRLISGDVPEDTEASLAIAQEAQAHALIAIADALGIAHDTAAPKETGNAG